MKIQVLGSGCPTCKKMHEITVKAIEELGLDEEVEYITGGEGVQKIIEIGAMSSPVLAINGESVIVGSTPDIETVKNVISKKVL